MGAFRFSNRALEDLDAIASYTVGEWGAEQAVRYLSQLERASAGALLPETATLHNVRNSGDLGNMFANFEPLRNLCNSYK